eukprot:7129231-Prymnesium_polylepis.1
MAQTNARRPMIDHLGSEAETKEHNAHDERHEDTGVLSLGLNEQDPSREYELAAHFERLPKIGVRLGRCGNALEERLAAYPQQGGVQQGDPQRPDPDKDECGGEGFFVFFRVTRELQGRLQVAPDLAVAVGDMLAMKGLEDAHRRARYDQEREAQHERQDTTQRGVDCSGHPLSGAVDLSVDLPMALPQELDAHRTRRIQEHETKGPG